jgi:thiol-disulfide isomerase/thioredoxin
MIKNICLFFMVLLGTGNSVSAQVVEIDSIMPVPVGGNLPKAFWDFKHSLLERGVRKEYMLSSDRGKLVILDFWATWCGSCIKRFPKLEEIEKAFPGKVKVLLVNSVGTGDSEESLISRFKSGSGTFTSTGLSVVAGDKVFLKAFPHRALPHYVWIADGGIRAVTTAELLTVENVALLLEHMDVLEGRRKKIEADRTKMK